MVVLNVDLRVEFNIQTYYCHVFFYYCFIHCIYLFHFYYYFIYYYVATAVIRQTGTCLLSIIRMINALQFVSKKNRNYL